VSDSRRYLNPPPADAAYLPGHSPDGPSKAHALLLDANAFLGEFFHHAVIQTKLERALRQGRAVLHGGVPFDVTHAASDISRLLETRSLWPGVACHYLINWLSAILAATFRS
jgi:hypothetical protein